MALEPPRIADNIIVEALEVQYDLAVVALTFLPIGNDPASWVYRVEAGEGLVFFLKVRARNGFSAASLRVPYALQQQGLPHVLAPLPKGDGALWVDVEAFMLALYPFVEGQNGAEAGLSTEQWRAFGALVKQIHTCRLPAEISQHVRHERFVPSRRHVIAQLEEVIHRNAVTGDLQEEWLATWQSQREVIGTLVARVDRLGDHLRRTKAPRTLCHADMHPWNVHLDGAGDWWLIDWDDVVLARKECDLMFVVGGIGGDGVGPRQTEWFLQGYGNDAINALALAYYRTAWAVQDIAAYGEELFFTPNLGYESRRAALRGFKSLFNPGNIVERALASPT